MLPLRNVSRFSIQVSVHLVFYTVEQRATTTNGDGIQD